MYHWTFKSNIWPWQIFAMKKKKMCLEGKSKFWCNVMGRNIPHTGWSGNVPAPFFSEQWSKILAPDSNVNEIQKRWCALDKKICVEQPKPKYFCSLLNSFPLSLLNMSFFLKFIQTSICRCYLLRIQVLINFSWVDQDQCFTLPAVTLLSIYWREHQLLKRAFSFLLMCHFPKKWVSKTEEE